MTQNNELCYSFDSKSKTVSTIRLQKDEMNEGFLEKPSGTSYIDPTTILLEENETLMLIDEGKESERWEKIPCYAGKKLYHRINKSMMSITVAGKSPVDYPDYTDKQPPDNASFYYNFSESEGNWIFDLEKYRIDMSNRITSMCIEENYAILPQYKRDNVYSGLPANGDYPPYLQGEQGKTSIAKLNKIYQEISKVAKSKIESAVSQAEIDNIISEIIFPSEMEILSLMQDSYSQ